MVWRIDCMVWWRLKVFILNHEVWLAEDHIESLRAPTPACSLAALVVRTAELEDVYTPALQVDEGGGLGFQASSFPSSRNLPCKALEGYGYLRYLTCRCHRHDANVRHSFARYTSICTNTLFYEYTDSTTAAPPVVFIQLQYQFLGRLLSY